MASWLFLSSSSTFSFFFIFIFFFSSFVTETGGELITALPGQPLNVTFNQYSGYIVTDTHHGRALFYYFVEAAVADPSSRPLTLWLNGGPGCSSLGFGAFMEHGPFQPGDNEALIHNKYSWNLESNILYLETPIGVGFSYSNTSSDYINWNDTKTAEENLKFILKWLEEFPKYKDSELYLTGESYAGHYIPQLAALILQYNKHKTNKMINLKAVALGNPLLDLDISVKAGDYLWSHGVISDKTLKLEKTVCDDTRYLREYYHDKMSQECNDVFDRVEYEIGDDIDRGDLLLPKCLFSSGALQAISKGKHGQIHAKLARRKYGDPCLGDRVFAYLNLPQVQAALHANTTHLPYQWDFCLGPLVYQEDNVDMNVIPVVANLIHKGIPVMLYSGDQDTKIPLTQTRIITQKLAKYLKLKEFTRYGPWYDKKQVGGWAQSFGAWRDGKNVTYLTFAAVRGAAHEVPFTSPSPALALFRAFLSGSPLTPS